MVTQQIFVETHCHSTNFEHVGIENGMDNLFGRMGQIIVKVSQSSSKEITHLILRLFVKTPTAGLLYWISIFKTINSG